MSNLLTPTQQDAIVSYSTSIGGAASTTLLTQAQGWMALIVGGLTMILLIIRIMKDWPDGKSAFHKKFKRKKGKK